MTDCKSPLEVIMSHEYCFGDLGEELEKWKDRKFPYRNKVKNQKSCSASETEEQIENPGLYEAIY